MQITGREFSDVTLARIRARIQGDPTLTRTALSREVCEWLDWRGPEGRPQDMSCRVALLTLARRGLIELPPAQPVSFARAADTEEPAFIGLTFPGSLTDLGRIWLTPVDSSQPESSRMWWAMMQAHHPQGAGPLCGAQIRYQIVCDKGLIGGLSFSAPAWRLAPRDAWIGWDETARRAGLSRIVGNSRFLILPTVQVPNLASHVLSLAVKRLPADWQARYGITPVLVETFVDRAHYRAPVTGPPTGFSWVKPKGGVGKTAPMPPRGPSRIFGSLRCNPIGKRSCKRTGAVPP